MGCGIEGVAAGAASVLEREEKGHGQLMPGFDAGEAAEWVASSYA